MSNRFDENAHPTSLESNILTERLDWERQFVNCCKADGVANKTWTKLDGAGVGYVCKELLWWYFNHERYSADIQPIVHNLKALGRAQRVKQESLSDPRAGLFSQRYEEAAETALQSPWPFDNSDVRTVGEAALKYPGTIGALSIDKAGSSLAKDRESVRRFGAKFLLVILRVGAEAHSVHVTPNSLAALANCADPNHDLDGRSLRRFLKEPSMLAAEPQFLALFQKMTEMAP